MEENNYKRTTVTTALPYANGPVHIGHLAGVYVPADVYVRYLRSKGKDVLFIGGSDEHGVPITIKARQEGISPQDIVNRYHTIIKKSFEDFGIGFDIYSRTSKEIHHKTSSEFFTKLNDDGHLNIQTSMQFYDIEANQFLADRYITGTCPHCGYDKAYGDQCEKCGTSLSGTDLINPRSALSGNTPILKETSHWYLPLDKYQPWLEKWILEDHKDWKTNVYGQCKSWLNQGLQARAVTRDLDWGVKVPLPNAEGKVLYVWFDAPIGYISATKDWSEKSGKDWTPYWKDQSTRLIHFIGKDNIVFHCIIFPAMLHAEGSYILPENVPANEFLNLEGDKISTSRNWAVWLHEYLEEFPNMQDVLRYVLTSNAPETKDNDFTWKDFQARNNNELLAIYGNFINRSLVLVHKYFEGKVPDNTLPEEWNSIKTQLIELKIRIEDSISHFRFREALSLFMDIARMGNKFLTDSEPWKIWKTEPSKVEGILYISLQIAANLAILGEPFLPFTSEKIFRMLKINPLKWEASGNEILHSQHQIGEPELLFSRIEDETVDFQLSKLQATRKANENSLITVIPIKQNIEFDEFGKMDIRVGTIVDAEKVAKTKKLMKVIVDLGFEKRTIVSGVAEYFEPKDLIGKKVPVLLNLSPRDLKGIQSNGMILFAENVDGTLNLVSPSENAINGSLIK